MRFGPCQLALLLVLIASRFVLSCAGDAQTSPGAETVEPDAPDSPDADTAADDATPVDADSTDTADAADPVVTVRMDFTRGDGFWSAPWPELSRQTEAGIDLSGFRHRNNALVQTLLAMVAERDGAPLTSTLYLPLTGAIDPATLPDVAGSLEPTATVFVTRVDADAIARHPVRVELLTDRGGYGAAPMLAVLPYQGRPLEPDALYAVVATTGVRDLAGRPLGVAPELDALPGLDPSVAADYRLALDALDGIDVAGLAVFRTGRPTAGLDAVVDAMRAEPLPEPLEPWSALEIFDDYCVFATRIELPVYQGGEPPYASAGGGWVFDDAGQPQRQRWAASRVFVTLPRRAMPAAGFAPIVFVRTGGGGDRPLIDRGPRGEPGGAALEPGTGLARELARAGAAGFSVDGPHGGLRNVTGGDEQFLMFNVTNPVALRDNVRQSAAELARLPDVLDALSIDASSCPGLSTPAGDGLVRFDLDHLGLIGHSMGATIAPLVLAADPRYRAVVLSGAGGSWIENVMHKQSPVAVKPAAELLLGYGAGELDTFDPVLALFQWAAEEADPPVYGARAAASRHALMVQGIVDTYILPPIANTTTLSMALDAAGPLLDASHPELTAFDPLADVLILAGRAAIALPASGNADGGAATAVVVQHAEGPIEDGHEVMFQLDAPRHQVRCFFETWLANGIPTVPVASTDPAAACR